MSEPKKRRAEGRAVCIIGEEIQRDKPRPVSLAPFSFRNLQAVYSNNCVAEFCIDNNDLGV